MFMRRRGGMFSLIAGLALLLSPIFLNINNAVKNAPEIDKAAEEAEYSEYIESLFSYDNDDTCYTDTNTTLVDRNTIPVVDLKDVNDISTAYAVCSSLLWDGQIPMVELNNNEPFIIASDYSTNSFESYSELDSLGRTGVAVGCISPDTMPKTGETREDISSVYPSGFNNKQYDGIDEYGWLYNRCHLIAWCLSSENANERNLITGTRYLNVEGMLPFEEDVANYISATNNHVLYRVTPVYTGNDLLCKGLIMEAYSIEDNGALSFCVFCFNVQPGITIDYATGNSAGPKYTGN